MRGPGAATRRRRPHPRGDGGAALVEFGLLLPLFFAIFVGVVTSGLAVFARLQVSTAAQEGARVMYVGGTAGQAQAAVAAAAVGTVDPVRVNGAPVAAAWTCATGTGPRVVDVRITRTVDIVWLVTIPVTVQGRAVTRCV